MTASPPGPRPLPPSLAARFEVTRVLGRGSFGEVVEVREAATGARYALKRLPLEGEGRRELRELAAARRVDHPHVLRCHEVGHGEGEAWLLTDVAEGSLVEVLADPARRAEARALVLQAARGVAALHREGLIHRDLKPDNVLVLDGAARIADFGMAKGVDLATVTRTGMILGTPHYMAPEQARGERLGPAADVFALGVLVHEAVAGRLPYPSEDPLEVLARVARGRPISLEGLALPPGMEKLLRQALDPDASRRPADLEAWIEDLEASWTDDASGATEVPDAGGGGRVPRATLRATAPAPPATRSDFFRTRRGPILGGSAMAALAVLLLVSSRPAARAPAPDASPAPPATPGTRAADAEAVATLEGLRRALLEDDRVRDALGTPRIEADDAGDAALAAARASLRDRLAHPAVQGALEDLAAAPPSPEVHDLASRIDLVRRLLDPRPPWAPLDALDRLLARGSWSRPRPPHEAPTTGDGDRDLAAVFAALGSSSARWSRLDPPGGEPRPPDDRVHILDFDDQRFLVPGATRPGVAEAPARLTYALPEVRGDALQLAVVGRGWSGTRHAVLEVRGASGSAVRAVATLPASEEEPAEGPGPRRVVLAVRWHRDALPPDPRELRLTIRGIQARGPPDPEARIAGVLARSDPAPWRPLPETEWFPAETRRLRAMASRRGHRLSEIHRVIGGAYTSGTAQNAHAARMSRLLLAPGVGARSRLLFETHLRWITAALREPGTPAFLPPNGPIALQGGLVAPVGHYLEDLEALLTHISVTGASLGADRRTPLSVAEQRDLAAQGPTFRYARRSFEEALEDFLDRAPAPGTGPVALQARLARLALLVSHPSITTRFPPLVAAATAPADPGEFLLATSIVIKVLAKTGRILGPSCEERRDLLVRLHDVAERLGDGEDVNRARADLFRHEFREAPTCGQEDLDATAAHLGARLARMLPHAEPDPRLAIATYQDALDRLATWDDHPGLRDLRRKMQVRRDELLASGASPR